jgi:hypothetical protein
MTMNADHRQLIQAIDELKKEIQRNRPMSEDMDLILEFFGREYQQDTEKMFTGEELQQALDIEPARLNVAIDFLSSTDLIERYNYLGTSPYRFGQVRISSRGIYELERRKSYKKAISDFKPINFDTQIKVSDFESFMKSLLESKELKPPTPVGSPYGFTAYDWELVSSRKSDLSTLYVVLGTKFVSSYYDTVTLRQNILELLERGIKKYNDVNNSEISLEYIILKAGLGEHLFNQIARDIISSDIAIFETSDLAPNVFLEIGVALTWGSRVFLVKHKDAPNPSSDISGHTYTEYSDNASDIIDETHVESVFRIVERAIWKKG